MLITVHCMLFSARRHSLAGISVLSPESLRPFHLAFSYDSLLSYAHGPNKPTWEDETLWQPS